MKKQDSSIRWDRVIGFITIITILVCAFIIYEDFRPDDEIVMAEGESTRAEETTTIQSTVSSQAVVCIDAGHGGSDVGGEYLGEYEKDQNLSVALKLQTYLESQQVKVVMTRTTDKAVSVEERVQIGNAANAAAVISIHRNYYEGTENVYGAEAWIHSSEPANSQTLAGGILSRLEMDVDEDNRGVRMGTIEDSTEDYYINAKSKSASCILELGFMTSKADESLVTTNIDATAKAIGDGIINYLKITGYING